MKTEQQIAQEVAPSILQKLCPAGVIMSSVSLQFTADATEETIRTVDAFLEEVAQSHLYQVGDYLNYLCQAQGSEIARQRIARAYAPETMRVAMWLTKHVTPQRRLISPSFNHSLLVAKMQPTDQEIWLTKAREEALTVKQLRAELRQRSAIGKGAPNQAPVDQAASRASEAFEVFRVWYQANAPGFEDEQRAEWNAALLPLVTDYVARQDDDDFETLCLARREFSA